jgi:hypothetical protein
LLNAVYLSSVLIRSTLVRAKVSVVEVNSPICELVDHFLSRSNFFAMNNHKNKISLRSKKTRRRVLRSYTCLVRFESYIYIRGPETCTSQALIYVQNPACLRYSRTFPFAPAVFQFHEPCRWEYERYWRSSDTALIILVILQNSC